MCRQKTFSVCRLSQSCRTSSGLNSSPYPLGRNTEQQQELGSRENHSRGLRKQRIPVRSSFLWERFIHTYIPRKQNIQQLINYDSVQYLQIMAKRNRTISALIFFFPFKLGKSCKVLCSNLFWPGIEVLELAHCVKWRFCSCSSQINSLGVRL